MVVVFALYKDGRARGEVDFTKIAVTRQTFEIVFTLSGLIKNVFGHLVFHGDNFTS
jgi:hypothetical protein